MAGTFSPVSGQQQWTPESLRTPGKYLELSLEIGGSLIKMRPRVQACAMYVGNPAGPENDLGGYGTIEEALADAILRFTHVGINCLEVDGQRYRFVRSCAHIGCHAADVFAPG
jgi:hypothetical protein